MTVNSKGDHGEPIVQDPPTTIADFAAHAAYTRLTGNRIVGTSSQRNSFSSTYGFNAFIGLSFFETDTNNEYTYIPSGWAGTSTDGSIVAFSGATSNGVSDLAAAPGGGFQASRDVTFRNPTRFTAAPIITLGVFTGASNDQHAGIVNLTTTGFTLYYWRANQAATSVGWTATPNVL
jgi:hypothetical protein